MTWLDGTKASQVSSEPIGRGLLNGDVPFENADFATLACHNFPRPGDQKSA